MHKYLGYSCLLIFSDYFMAWSGEKDLLGTNSNEVIRIDILWMELYIILSVSTVFLLKLHSKIILYHWNLL